MDTLVKSVEHRPSLAVLLLLQLWYLCQGCRSWSPCYDPGGFCNDVKRGELGRAKTGETNKYHEENGGVKMMTFFLGGKQYTYNLKGENWWFCFDVSF